MDVVAPGVASRLAVRSVPAAAKLGLLVALAGVVQTLLAWRRPTPGYFPDEYMYAELGRSLLESGSPLVRGTESGMLPILYPLLTAPAWLWSDVETAYRTIQALNAFAMAAAAVPAFLLARRLGAGTRLALAAAALTVALPELLYSSSILAEPLAYPLALCTALLVVMALERPLLRTQAALLVIGGLAAATRLQLVVLPLCYLGAVAAVGLRGRGVRLVLREQWLGAGVTGAAVTAGTLLFLLAPLGLYGSLGAYSFPRGEIAAALGTNALVLAYAAGWVLVPPALAGLALALARPRSTAEVAFGGYTVVLLPLLLLEASAFGDVGRAQERYAIYAVPVLVAAFALAASRNWPLLRLQGLLAAVLALGAALVPLAGHAAAGGAAQSHVLTALTELEERLGDVGLSSLLVALGATGASALVLLVAARSSGRATQTATVLTLVSAALITAGAATQLEERRAELRSAYLPSDRSWVDRAAAEPVTLLALPRSSRADLHTTLFWNRSVDRLLLLGDTRRPDPFASPRIAPDAAGRLDATAPGLLLVDGHGSWLDLRGAEPLAAAPTKQLFRTAGPAQLRALLTGRYYTGLLAAEGAIRAWPAVAGGRIAARLELELRVPGGQDAVAFTLHTPTGRSEYTIPADGVRRLSVPICSTGEWRAGYSTGSGGLLHGTRVGLLAGEPRLLDDPSVCR